MGLLHHRYYSKAAEPGPWRPPPYLEIQKQIGMILRKHTRRLRNCRTNSLRW